MYSEDCPYHSKNIFFPNQDWSKQKIKWRLRAYKSFIQNYRTYFYDSSFIYSFNRWVQWQPFEAYLVKLKPGQNLLEEWLMREKSKLSPERTKTEKRQKTKGKEQRRHEGIKIEGKKCTGKLRELSISFFNISNKEKNQQLSFAYFKSVESFASNAGMTPKTHSMHLVISYISPRTQLSQAVCTCYYRMSILLLVEYINENQSFHNSIM